MVFKFKNQHDQLSLIEVYKAQNETITFGRDMILVTTNTSKYLESVSHAELVTSTMFSTLITIQNSYPNTLLYLRKPAKHHFKGCMLHQ